MLLKKVTVNKYKSYLQEQTFEIEEGVTRIVGKNESGKSAILEALAKFNYFEDDNDFEYVPDLDYPRNELKRDNNDKSKIIAILCSFELEKQEIDLIENEVGKGTLLNTAFSLSKNFGNKLIVSGLDCDFTKFRDFIIDTYKPNQEFSDGILQINNIEDMVTYCTSHEEELPKLTTKLSEMKTIYDKSELEPLCAIVYQKIIAKRVPKFWYFDEFYTMPSCISIEELLHDPDSSNIKHKLTKEARKIVDALISYGNLDLKKLQDETNFELFRSELEAASNGVSDELFEYWGTNENLELKFEIQHTNDNHKILNIRIYNNKHRVTLPLKNRSKGFIWFFSFFVWFSYVQKIKSDCRYILLLDEPGLNLHASAQKDLLRVIDEKLAPTYQVMYTTHSPFMVESSKLNEIRTVFDSPNKKDGSIISSALEEKDSDTLFPLQAALGYDIAQNLFIAEKNLLVEGISDLMFLSAISEELNNINREGLANGITIVPVGGMDKVATFISLLRGQELNIVCLLDNFNDQSAKQRLETLIKSKIIKEQNIRYCGEFAELSEDVADLEDLFAKSEYLRLFNLSFSSGSNARYKEIKETDIPNQDKRLLSQINKILSISHFNHYMPANEFLKIKDKKDVLSDRTLGKFENLFKIINRLFSQK